MTPWSVWLTGETFDAQWENCRGRGCDYSYNSEEIHHLLSVTTAQQGGFIWIDFATPFDVY
jgi:hypothetical protein